MSEAIICMTETAAPPSDAMAARPTIAASLVEALLELAVSKGGNRPKLLERSGIDVQALQDRNGRLPLAQWVALMRIASEACGDPALALHFGQAFDVGHMSVVGLMFRSVGTKGEALAILNRFCRLVIDVETEGLERFQLVRKGKEVWMIDTRLNPNDTPEISEAALSQMAAMGQLLLPGGEHFRAVHFTHAAPAYRSEYHRVFQVPVSFESDRNGFLMPEDWQSVPIALQPRYALDILTDYAEELLERLDDGSSLSRRVEALLTSTLTVRRPTGAAVASDLGLTEQTLYRRLKAEGFKFQELLAGLRLRLATHCLREKKMSVKDTAYCLGFSAPASFSRAFKRWAGVSPEEFTRAGQGRKGTPS